MSSPIADSETDPVVAKAESSNDEVRFKEEDVTESPTTRLNDDNEVDASDDIKQHYSDDNDDEPKESIAKQEEDVNNATDDANSDEDELSDLDEEEVVAKAEAAGTIPIDEEVYKLQRHKKQGVRSTSTLPKEKTRQKKNKLTPADLGRVENDYADDDNDANVPGATKGSSKKRRGKSDDIEDEIPDDQLDPEARRRREFERRIQATGVVANKRRKKTNDDVLDQFQDEMVNNLREKMRTAAIEDAECVRNGTPAMSKLKLLPEVKDVLRKGSLADTILDNNLLEAVRIWLEPLPDASLPAYEIQKELFSALDRLPIKTIHLRESGLGKVVIFYQKSKRPQLNIKRTVDKLVGDWTRPIMGRSDNYRDKIVASRTYNVREDDAYKRRGAVLNATPANSKPADLAEASALRRNRAHIPSAGNVSYDVAPKSFVQNAQLSSQQRASNDENYKRMKMKLMKKKPTSRKSGVSIEGR
ncbi:hypothetical protein D0Z03_001898 [Geotrichum reessii]|nr:hypothetical protein D0Z03_001898 [Galactomyces reessii]